MTRILIVDDKEENIYYLQALLTAHGCEVESARHGAEALVKARLSPPDLVISDLLMPVMDGYTLLRLWKADASLRKLPFIVYTATYTEPEDERLALSLGADAFILKPTEPEEFLIRLRRVQENVSTRVPLPPKTPVGDENELLKVYSETLIRKLEEKTLQLEETNRALQEDIARRKKAEDELRWKTAFLEAQVNSSLDGILVVDSEGRKILQNQRMRDLWKIPPHIAGDADDRVQVDFVTRQTKNPGEFAEKVARLYTHPDEVCRDEVELVDGTILDRFTAPVKDEEGNYYGRIWVFRDVTLERNREVKLAESLAQEMELSEKARAGERAKSEFLAVMSHEVRTPLHGILGFSELLANAPDLSPESRDSVKIIASSGEALLRILDDVLDFSRLEAGRLQIRKNRFSPREILGDIRTLLAQQAADKGLDLVLSIAPDVPQYLDGDAGRLRQILLNLTGNAIKFTERGSVTLGLRSGSSAGLYEGFTRDTGPGLAPDQLERIFQPFTQADSSISRRHGGTGLGLSISRRLAQLMGGTLEVRSQPGHGSEFVLTVPLADAPFLRKDAAGNPVATLDAEFAIRHPLRILVVEDDKVNLKLIVIHMRRLGYEPLSAKNGREAVEIHEREQPDCILMDLQMPEMDGIEATENIRARERKSPPSRPVFISALTANIFPADRQRCLHAGMDGYLNKPVKLADLADILEQAAEFKAGRNRHSCGEQAATAAGQDF